MSENPKKKNDLVFLGINFHNFFQNCCIARKLEEKALSSEGDGDRQHQIFQKKQQKEHVRDPNKINLEQQNEDGHSVASSTDWTDLEDLLLPNAFPLKDATMDEEAGMNTETPVDDYMTQEPIDFEYLRDITGVDKEEDEKSATSGLSHNSKKIVKEKVPNVNRTQRSPRQKDSGIKGKRKAWQPHEDARVLELVGKYGQSWAVIASMMQGRTGKQIRDRYLNKLKPNIKKGEWTLEEDHLLLSCYYQLGHKWSKIATFLPGRTEGQVKNRFYSHLKKRIPNLDDDPQRYAQVYTPSQTSPGMETLMGTGALYEYPRPITQGTPSSETSYGGSGESSPPSGNTMATETPKIYYEKDIDDILDRVAGYIEHKPETKVNAGSTLDLEKMSMEEKLAAVSNKENMGNNIEKLKQMEKLENRKKKLEFLLAHTLKDMEMMNPQSINHGKVLGESNTNIGSL